MKLSAKEKELLAAATYGLKDFEEKTETDETLRRTEIRERYNRLRPKETVDAMIARYEGYGHGITKEGYIHG